MCSSDLHRDASADGTEREDSSYSYRLEPAESEDVETDAAVVNINKAVKTIQIAGQILRNYGSKLSGSRKLQLADACYGLTMRMLKWIY